MTQIADYMILYRSFACLYILIACFPFSRHRRKAAAKVPPVRRRDGRDGLTEKLFEVCTALAGRLEVWALGPGTQLLLLGAGVYLSFCAGFPQLRRFGEMLRVTLGSAFARGRSDNGISPFQAVSTALAGTVGTGNIAGVAGAVALGGPGAVFWMWFSAFWGMATKYAEVLLAVRYRERGADGQWLGGPMYTIKNGLGPAFRPLAGVFSLFGMLAAFGIGNLAQANTIAETVSVLAQTLCPGSLPAVRVRLAVGLLLALAAGGALLGGVRRIGALAEKLVPAMSLLYIAGALTVIFANGEALPDALRAIFIGAFCPRAVLGGAAGIGLRETIRLGAGRGVFSNEAGLGSAPIAHAATSETDPSRQALFGIFEVFADTIVICTLTALAILTSGVAVPYGKAAGAGLAISAFARTFGDSGAAVLIAVCLVFFAFSSILSWSLYGCRCAQYLFGPRSQRPYQLAFTAAIVFGSVCELSLAWRLADTLNVLMAAPNLLSVLALSAVVRREGKK